MDGFLCIDKPDGPSSFSMVARVRRVLNPKKIGHCGTLDPAATGLLVIALGKAPKLLPFLNLNPKKYSFTIKFGTQTDTLDSKGEVVESSPVVPDAGDIKKMLSRFRGEIDQVPPLFSAVKIKGVRAYKMARKKRDVQMKSKKIIIHSLTMSRYDQSAAVAAFRCTCSSGTYIRSLARDISKALGTCGHAASIRRTGVGPFSLEQAVDGDEISESCTDHIVSLWDACADLPRVIITDMQKKSLGRGNSIYIANPPLNGDIVFAFGTNGELCAALNKKSGDRLHPARVFV